MECKGIMSVEIRNLCKRFGDTVVCDTLNLSIPSGELVALLGPSGSGKTSLLRIIAGLERPDSGSVFLHDREATYDNVRDREVGFVFQHYALFGHMTLFENVAFGLRVMPKAVRSDAAAIHAKVDKLLELVQLDGLGNRYPHQLSGGQRQRIALARALAVDPKVLLLDEPFGALDARVRKELRRWLRTLHDEVHVTSVFVTHDQDEALEVADRVVLMNLGRIEQDGTPGQVYDHPANSFVLQFLGDVNILQRRSRDRMHASEVLGFVRPQELVFLDHPGEGAIPVTLSQVFNIGPAVRIECRRRDEGSLLDVEMPRRDYRVLQARLGLKPGGEAWLRAREVIRFDDVQIEPHSQPALPLGASEAA